MPDKDLKLEFRIPISPTPGFFAQIRLFHFSLQQLGPLYRNARLRIVVGDNCDLGVVIAANSWADGENIAWNAVPRGLFDVADIWATANWRLSIPAGDADVVILSDADTVLLRDIDPILADFDAAHAVVRGHVAHYPPPIAEGPAGPDYWAMLLSKYGANWNRPMVRYSMDIDNTLPLAPPYYNLGFVAMNPAALSEFGRDIHWTEEWLRKFHPSHMRCQIALTLIAAAQDMDAGYLPATYNAANDIAHFSASGMTPADVRVLHYLRETEFKRASFLLPGEIEAFLEREPEAIMNRELRELVRAWRATW